MGTMKVYEAIAHAIQAEGIEAHFGLAGDANMHLMAALGELKDFTNFSVRHEHAAVMMAAGYWSKTGKPGIASVTHGPGYTQIMTALTTAARNRVPLVIFAGETATGAKWHLQRMDQAPLAVACGASYIEMHNPALVHHQLREAFYTAKTERKPVVVGIPYDIQKMELPAANGKYQPSSTIMPKLAPVPPDERQIDEILHKLINAKSPVLVAGRGALWADARREIEQLAEKSGALLGTTLMGKGMFDHNPYSLGIVGGYARQASRDVGQTTDLVIAFGATLGRFTLDSGKMFPKAKIVQIDLEPKGYREGLEGISTFARADAKLAAAALLAKLGNTKTSANVRTPALAKRLKETPTDSTVYPDNGKLDPREVIDTLETIIPTDYDFVSGNGHQAYWHTTMRGADPSNYHATRGFGAIGNAFPFAMGIAATRKDGRVVLFEGDGGLIMHIQELESLKREGVKVLVVCLDDAAFGAEIHKLREENIEDKGVVFGHPPFEQVAKAFGLRGATVTRLDQFKDLMKEYEAGDTSMIWDVHISDLIMAPNMRDDVGYGKKK